jgi:hypothetical protein
MQHIIVCVINFIQHFLSSYYKANPTNIILFVSADSWHHPVKWQKSSVAANIAVRSASSFSSADPSNGACIDSHTCSFFASFQEPIESCYLFSFC